MHNYHGPYCIVARLSSVHCHLRTMDNCPVPVPIHANQMKQYFHPADRPIDPSCALNDVFDLSESDLSNYRLAGDTTSTELEITCPEDVHPLQEIKDNVTLCKPGSVVLWREVCGAKGAFSMNYELLLC